MDKYFIVEGEKKFIVVFWDGLWAIPIAKFYKRIDAVDYVSFKKEGK